MKCSHVTLLLIAGLVWLAAGLNLLPLGLRLLTDTLNPSSTAHTPLLNWLSVLFGSEEQIVLLLVAIGLFVGLLKYRMVLSKAVTREVTRIQALPNPTSLTNLYGKKALIVIAAMGFLSFLMKWLQVPQDIRGTIDVAIGAALINGAILFFRQAFRVRLPMVR